MTSEKTYEKRLVVLELDGVVVHDHTPSELIRAGFPHQPERYDQALDLYQQECLGLVHPEETLLEYAALARGLPLRRAIEYATFKMRFINGFDTFVEMLYRYNTPVVLTSSSFSVVTEAVRHLYGLDRFHAVAANPLAFALKKEPDTAMSEEKLAALVQRYFLKARDHEAYDKMVATGEYTVVTADPSQKTGLIAELAAGLNIPFEAVTYVCSSLKDRETLFSVVRSNGRGIVFNFETSAEPVFRDFLKDQASEDSLRFTTSKSLRANLRSVFEILFPDG